MISFSCPACNKAFAFPESMSGNKFACDCGQRVQVPTLANDPKKTVLGHVDLPPARPLPPPITPDKLEVFPEEPRSLNDSIVVRCYDCGAAVPSSKSEQRMRTVSTTSGGFSYTQWTASGSNVPGHGYTSSSTRAKVDVCHDCCHEEDEYYRWVGKIAMIVIPLTLLLVGSAVLIAFLLRSDS